MAILDPHKIEFRNLNREPVFLPPGRVIEKRDSSYGVCHVENKLLLVQSAYNSWWELPGGKVERGESSIEAMKREFQEETGFAVLDQEIKLLGENQEYFYDNINDQYFDSTMTFFYFHKISEIATNDFDRRDVSKVSWFSRDSMQIETHPISRKFINLALDWKINN